MKMMWTVGLRISTTLVCLPTLLVDYLHFVSFSLFRKFIRASLSIFDHFIVIYLLPWARVDVFMSWRIIRSGRKFPEDNLRQGPVPRKMVKFNPGLSQISSKDFSSKNMQPEVTKYYLSFFYEIE